jgi:D-threo-aldose 1-dehydrogenase
VAWRSWSTAPGIGAQVYVAIDDGVAASTLRAAWEAGVRYFYAAPHYWLGLSGHRLGAAWAPLWRRSGRLAETRVCRFHQGGPPAHPEPVSEGLGPANGFVVPDDLNRARDYSRDGVLRGLCCGS